MTPAKQDAAAQEEALRKTIDAWRSAWSKGDYDSYLQYYDPAFKGDAKSRAAWEKERRERLANGDIDLAFENIKIKVEGGGKAQASFAQRYTSKKHSDTGAKKMALHQVGGKWLIVGEQWKKTSS